MFKRAVFQEVDSRVREPRRVIHVVLGPRYSGKTTGVRQVLESLSIPFQYGSGDGDTLRGGAWLEEQWKEGRKRVSESGDGQGVLVLDEIQNVSRWSKVVSRLWDEDTSKDIPLRVVLVGSAPFVIQQKLKRDLAGKYEVVWVPHWSFTELREAFGRSLEEFIYFGSYPASGELLRDRAAWAEYMGGSVTETIFSRDILRVQRINKPDVLRGLFRIGCEEFSNVLSYNKMTKRLSDVGNTVTLAGYLNVLGAVGLLSGLEKFSGETPRKRGSSPKLQLHNTAFAQANGASDKEAAMRNPELWGRLVEGAVGANLYRGTFGTDIELFFWRERGREVDFVLRKGEVVVGIEVRSGRRRETESGIRTFERQYRPFRTFIVGKEGIEVGDFLQMPVKGLLTR